MKQLLIDIGNSRIKWARLANGRMGRMHALALTQLEQFESALLRMPPLHAVHVSSVAGQGIERRLRRMLASHGQPAPQLATTAAQAGGIRNSYREPWRLGVDRWLACIGAWHLTGHQPLCVASAGTALTIDAIDATGQHRGGLIVPGPTLMRTSLLGRTDGIAVRARGGRRGRIALPGLADNTRDAVDLGSLRACAALVDRCVADLAAQLDTTPRLLLTGGAACALLPLLQGQPEHHADLVLQGLAILAYAGAT